MTLQDLRDRQRQDKLEDIRRQVAEGRLVIRQMTAEERERYPPPSARPKTSPPQTYASASVGNPSDCGVGQRRSSPAAHARCNDPVAPSANSASVALHHAPELIKSVAQRRQRQRVSSIVARRHPAR
jgi:hypothetical protein